MEAWERQLLVQPPFTPHPEVPPRHACVISMPRGSTPPSCSARTAPGPTWAAAPPFVRYPVIDNIIARMHPMHLPGVCVPPN